jgi:hypothetical protein
VRWYAGMEISRAERAIRGHNTGRAPAPSPGAAGSNESRIRPCTADDLPFVASLFQRVFRSGESCDLTQLAAYLGTLFFEHPWRDPQLPSLISVCRDARVNGFIGVLPVRMSYRGTDVRAALSTSLMVDNPEADPLAGVRLLRSFLRGPQALSLTDTANDISRRMWQCFGGSVATQYSMDWIRILRPAQAAVALVEGRLGFAHALRHLARAADKALKTAQRPPFCVARDEAPLERAEPDAVQVSDMVNQYASLKELRPAWSSEELQWFLKHGASKEKHGDLTIRTVIAQTGRPIGMYLYYARPGGVALVLQILSSREHTATVVRTMLGELHDLGCAAVRGRTQPDLLDALLRNGCVLKPGSWVVTHSVDRELISCIDRGNAWITGLGGESWSRLIRGQFT